MCPDTADLPSAKGLHLPALIEERKLNFPVLFDSFSILNALQRFLKEQIMHRTKIIVDQINWRSLNSFILSFLMAAGQSFK